ncbi:hypothetical protein ABPG72_002034 [Tetrahymena utriculariae]
MNPQQFQLSQHNNQQGYVSTGIPGQPQKQPVNVQNILFLAGTVLAAINCFARADYNLPVFLVSYLLWEQDYGVNSLFNKIMHIKLIELEKQLMSIDLTQFDKQSIQIMFSICLTLNQYYLEGTNTKSKNPLSYDVLHLR